MQRQNEQTLLLLSTNRAQKNHTQVETLNISMKTFPFSESQDKTGKVLKEFRHKYFTETKGKRKGLIQINTQEVNQKQNAGACLGTAKTFEAKHGYKAEPLDYPWD